MTFLFEIVVPILVVVVMTIVGMDLRYEDFLRVREYPLLAPGIVVGQWIAAMLVAGLVGRLLDLPHAVAGGALLFAAAPVAALSNYYTQLAHGHLALAVTVTAVSNLLAAVATPVVAMLGFALFLGAEAAFELPAGKLALQAFGGLLLPLLAGMLIRRRAPAWTLRWRAVFQALGLLAIAAVLVFVVFDQFAAIASQFAIFLGASAAITLTMLAVGFAIVRIVAGSGDDRRALLWGFPARNVAVATLIAGTLIEQAEMASYVAVLFATQIAIIVPLGHWMGRTGAARARA